MQLMGQQLQPALKEWQVAIRALEQGDTIMLLRKGGIREAGKTFAVQHDRSLLYPTYEHQQPRLLKPPYDQQVEVVASGWHPPAVEISSWAAITDALVVPNHACITALAPFHIWNGTFVSERWQWQPNRPLTVLLLRVYRLPTAITLPYDAAYGGCKSWINLTRAIDLDGSEPVLAEATYRQRVEPIRDIMTTS